LVIVPEITVVLLLSIEYVPALVRLLRNTVLPPRLWINPVPLVVSVPPVMLTLLYRATFEPVCAEIVPPVLVQLPPLKPSPPPLVASKVLVLVDAPPGCSVIPRPLTLALMVPLFTSVSAPLPMLSVPEAFPPVMVDALVKVKLLPPTL